MAERWWHRAKPPKLYDQDDPTPEREAREAAEENARIADELARRKELGLPEDADDGGSSPSAPVVPDPLLQDPPGPDLLLPPPPPPGKAHVVVVDSPPAPSSAGGPTAPPQVAPVVQPTDPAQPSTPQAPSTEPAAPSRPTVTPRPSVPLAPVAAADGAPARSHPVSVATTGIVEAPVIGNGSKFGSSDWWDVSQNKRWWKLTPSGLAADFLCDAGTIGDSAVVAGSMRGWKHQIKAEQNEDSFYLGAATDRNGNEHIVAVLADGLSSASHSGYASRRATQMIGRGISARIEQAAGIDMDWAGPELAGVLATAAQRIGTFGPSDYGAPVAESNELGERDVLVTLTIAIVQAALSADGTRHVVAGFIGDSPLFVLNKDGWTKMTAIDPSEEIVENRTRAFPADKMCSMVEFGAGIDDVVVMVSDGVGNFIGHGDQKLALGEFLRAQWQKPVNTLTFLNHLNFNLNSADDDRTAIAIWSAVEEKA